MRLRMFDQTIMVHCMNGILMGVLSGQLQAAMIAQQSDQRSFMTHSFPSLLAHSGMEVTARDRARSKRAVDNHVFSFALGFLLGFYMGHCRMAHIQTSYPRRP